MALWIVVAAMAQTVVLGRGHTGWARPDLLLTVAMACAWVARPRLAIQYGFVAGLATDLLSCGPVGTSAAIDLLAVWAVLRARNVLFARRVWMQVPISLALAFGAASLHLALLFAANTQLAAGPLLADAGRAAVTTAFLVPLVIEAMGGVTWLPTTTRSMLGRGDE